MDRQNCFLRVDLMKKILSSTKLRIFLHFGRNVYQASIDRQKKDEGREGSSGSWRSWSSNRDCVDGWKLSLKLGKQKCLKEKV